MLFALVSVVAMGQEVKVDTVAADSLTADTVKADTYVEQEGMTVYAEIKDHFTPREDEVCDAADGCRQRVCGYCAYVL